MCSQARFPTDIAIGKEKEYDQSKRLHGIKRNSWRTAGKFAERPGDRACERSRHQALRPVRRHSHRRAASFSQADRLGIRECRLHSRPAHPRGPSAYPQALRGRRNVSAPLPHFVETFMDNGYYDMYKIMKALRDVNYDGIVILDHSPSVVRGGNAQTAYGFAYMRALQNRANAEAQA